MELVYCAVFAAIVGFLLSKALKEEDDVARDVTEEDLVCDRCLADILDDDPCGEFEITKQEQVGVGTAAVNSIRGQIYLCQTCIKAVFFQA